jgi:hypothetical protein
MINIDEIKECLEAEKSQVFRLNYTKEQKYCFANFDIKKRATYSHFGSITNLDASEFLADIGNNSPVSIAILADSIKQLALEVCKGYNKKHAWIDIRITLPSKMFDIPRWHMDGKFFTSPEDNELLQTKFITSLKGPGTIMINATKTEKQKYNDLMKDDSIINRQGDAFRKKTNEIFKNRKVHQLTNNQGLIFVVGRESALVHSEPPIHEKRIFVSVLPGTERQIEQLKMRWNR